MKRYEKEEKERIINVCKNIDTKIKVNDIHPLLKKRKSVKLRKNLKFYEIDESEEIRKRINSLYNIIFSAVEELGYKIEERDGMYIALIKEEKIPFQIRERAKIQYREPTENDIEYRIRYINGEPKVKEVVESGNLELRIDFHGKKNIWKDTPKTRLEDVIGDIIIELFYCATKKKEDRLKKQEEDIKYEKQNKKDKNKILFRKNNLKKLFKIGKKISKIEIGITATTRRTYILEDIIEKMVLHLGSFSKIITDCYIRELDISILAAAARNIMECSNTYYYYAERKITDKEIEFRYLISSLHYNSNMMDIIKKFGYPEDNDRTISLNFWRRTFKEAIMDSPIYKKLTKNERSQVLNGNKAYITKRQKEVHRILQENIESAIYNIFSNSDHSYFLGLGNNSMNINFMHVSYISPEMLLCLSTEISILYSANVLEDYLRLRRTLKQYLTEEERIFIKDMTSKDKFLEWLDIQKEEYVKSFFYTNFEEEIEDIIL